MSEKRQPKLWGGRFSGETDRRFAEFNRSLDFDRRLFGADIGASLAHCDALTRAGVLSPAEADQIRSALNTILEKGRSNPDYLDDPSAEDVHSFVEARLVEIVGTAGYKLHTGRSRNDQVATDLRLWLRDEIDHLLSVLTATQTALLDLAGAHSGAPLPGYTHLQRAQPILFAHWCLAYFEMLARDRQRMLETRSRVNVLPLGSAALAGTSYDLDREAMARSLGFDGVSRNSLDAVSDRDFCVEFAAAASLIMLHLSRLAEDIILYSTKEFGFFELGDAVATGSSLMPQKKNPDSMELVRGKAGRVAGDLVKLLIMMKGLPLAYNKDMQEDKEAVFEVADTVTDCLEITATVLKNVRLDEARAHEAASTGYLNATELSDYLVRKGIPFREAHDMVGRIVRQAISRGVELGDLQLSELKSFSNLIEQDVFECLELKNALANKSQRGGTSPERVAEALAAARQSLAN